MTQESVPADVTLRDFVPAEHPLRPIGEILHAALGEMAETFAAVCSESDRGSIPPQQLLRGVILQTLYSLRSERLLCEQLGYNMLFRWFVGLGLDKGPWDPSTYARDRDRVMKRQVMREIFGQVLERAKALLSSEHFSVDGTLVRAWASPPARSQPRLTIREIEVLKWTADGKTVDEISDLLAISVNTVNFHIKNAVAKLQTVNKTAAAVRAAMLGLLDGYRLHPPRAEHIPLAIRNQQR